MGQRIITATVRAACAAVLLFTAATSLEAAGLSSYDWWWLFYEREIGIADTHLVVRPFYLVNEESSGNRFYASLMPIVYWAYESPRKYEWLSLLGLVHSVDYTHQNNVRDYDFGAFPFVFYGDSPEARDRYLLVWPFGGTIRGKLGQDRITAYLFPGFLLFFLYPPAFPPTLLNTAVLIASLIPLYVDYESRDYHAWGILWPLFQRGRSATRDDFRLLPFYAHNYKRGSYDNYSYLLLLNYQHVVFKDDEQKTFFFIPLYGRRWSLSGKTGSGTLLWPFFSWGYNRKAGSFELSFPWPLVQIQDSASPSVTKRIFFPFYGRYRYEEREAFFITPLHFTLRTETRNFESEYNINFLVIWYFKREYRKEPSPIYGSSWRYFKIWPLFQYERDNRGNMSFNTLSLLPWRDPEGYERLYQPFWTLFEYRRLEGGERRFGMLLRLYYQRWGDNFLHIKVPFLFTLGRENDRLTELSFLMSMFSYRRDGAGRRLRLFWIPFPLGGGGVATGRAPDSEAFAAMDYSDTALEQSEVAAYNSTSAFTMQRRMIFHTARIF
jgi:hypothetical protein